MIFQNTQFTDSLSVVKDSVISAVENQNAIPDINFNISNIGNSEIVITVLGYTIVFLALLVLYVFFVNFSKVLSSNIRKKLIKMGKELKEEKVSEISGETTAAISMALLLHFQESHDFENTILTIKKVQSTYSPWNSKLYGLRQYPKN